jgi:UPF0271 protein
MAERYVLDTSAILRTNDFSAGGYLMPDSVHAEVLNERARDAADASVKTGYIRRVNPGRAYVKSVLATAEETGDAMVLSAADVDVLALALEHKAAIISDDYAIQNTARKIGLLAAPTTSEGIREEIKWTWVCSGCRRSMKRQGVCNICGHKAKRTPSKD